MPCDFQCSSVKQIICLIDSNNFSILINDGIENKSLFYKWSINALFYKWDITEVLVFLQMEYGKFIRFPSTFQGNEYATSSMENKWLSFFLNQLSHH